MNLEVTQVLLILMFDYHTQAQKLISYNNSVNIKIEAVLRREKYLILQGNSNFLPF